MKTPKELDRIVDLVLVHTRAQEAELETLLYIVGWAYQFAGVYEAPKEILDILSAAAQRQSTPKDLPFIASPKLQQERDRLREALERAEEIMNHFGDVLNGMDCVDAMEEETGFQTSRIEEAFEIVRAALHPTPEPEAS